MNIILDKSYLVGAPAKSINDLLSKHRLMMSETLFLEILTSGDESHIQKCFGKFPQKENPVYLLPHSGNLMRFEKTSHKCSTPLEDRILDIRYEFNPNLRSGHHGLIIRKVAVPLEEWKKNASASASGFTQKAETVCDWFPELKDKTNISEEEKNKAIQKTSADINCVREVYSKLQEGILKNEGEKWPSAEIIDKEWALFRYVQFHLIGTLDLFWRHTSKEEKIVNAYLDMDYCILGSLTDGLATRDKVVEKFYRSVCPENILIN